MGELDGARRSTGFQTQTRKTTGLRMMMPGDQGLDRNTGWRKVGILLSSSVDLNGLLDGWGFAWGSPS